MKTLESGSGEPDSQYTPCRAKALLVKRPSCGYLPSLSPRRYRRTVFLDRQSSLAIQRMEYLCCLEIRISIIRSLVTIAPPPGGFNSSKVGQNKMVIQLPRELAPHSFTFKGA